MNPIQGALTGLLVWLLFYGFTKSVAREMEEANEESLDEGALRGLGEFSPGDVAHRP